MEKNLQNRMLTPPCRRVVITREGGSRIEHPAPDYTRPTAEKAKTEKPASETEDQEE